VRFVRVLVPSSDDAEEIVQQTMVTIWEQVDRFDEQGTSEDFFAWASRIAMNHARNHLRKVARARILFSTETMEALAIEWSNTEDDLEQRREALRDCIGQLAEDEQRMIEQCYVRGSSINVIAESLGRKTTSVYRSLRRIRRVLESCIERKLEEVGQ